MGKAVTQIACGRYIYTVLDQFTLHFVISFMDKMYMIVHVYVHSRKLTSKTVIIGVDLLVLHFTYLKKRFINIAVTCVKHQYKHFFFHFLLLKVAYTGLCCFIRTTVLFWGRREWTTGKQQIVECQ